PPRKGFSSHTAPASTRTPCKRVRPTLVHVGMGSNIRPQREIRAGLDRLAACFGRLTVSPAYRCAAIGFNGPPFINLVVSFTTTLGLADVVSILRRLERSRSYSRPQKIAGSKFWRHVVTTRRAVATDGTRQKKFSSRVLDLDLLLY